MKRKLTLISLTLLIFLSFEPNYAGAVPFGGYLDFYTSDPRLSNGHLSLNVGDRYSMWVAGEWGLPGGPDYIRGFDLDVFYDSSYISVVDISFGSLLGDPDNFFETSTRIESFSIENSYSSLTEGVRIGGFSWLDPTRLEFLQKNATDFPNPNYPKLFDITFETIAPTGPGIGFELFRPMQLAHHTPIGGLLTDDEGWNTVRIDLNGVNLDISSAAPVPEPSTIILLGTGLLGLVGWGRKKLK